MNNFDLVLPVLNLGFELGLFVAFLIAPESLSNRYFVSLTAFSLLTLICLWVDEAEEQNKRKQNKNQQRQVEEHQQVSEEKDVSDSGIVAMLIVGFGLGLLAALLMAPELLVNRYFISLSLAAFFLLKLFYFGRDGAEERNHRQHNPNQQQTEGSKVEDVSTISFMRIYLSFFNGIYELSRISLGFLFGLSAASVMAPALLFNIAFQVFAGLFTLLFVGLQGHVVYEQLKSPHKKNQQQPLEMEQDQQGSKVDEGTNSNNVDDHPVNSVLKSDNDVLPEEYNSITILKRLNDMYDKDRCDWEQERTDLVSQLEVVRESFTNSSTMEKELNDLFDKDRRDWEQERADLVSQLEVVRESCILYRALLHDFARSVQNHQFSSS